MGNDKLSHPFQTANKTREFATSLADVEAIQRNLVDLGTSNVIATSGIIPVQRFMPNDMLNAFDEDFELITADTPELLEQAFRLRYTVLCTEARAPGFEAARYPDGMETDDYDRHAHHLLLKHRPSGKFIGSARLILPDPSNPAKLFPLEQHTQIDPALIDTSKLPRQQTVEISRFILVGKYSRRREERRRSENSTVGGKRDLGNRRCFPHPMLAISVGIIRMCVRQGVTHWFSVMEPALNRLLGLYQLQLDPIGPLVDYHGPRRPYYAEISKVLDRLHTNNHQVWELVTDRGRVQPAPTKRTPDQAINANMVAAHSYQTWKSNLGKHRTSGRKTWRQIQIETEL